jgi:5-methyltetrahydrofolate--homocysteine methyltransferase
MRFADCVRGTTTLADGAWGTELQKHSTIPGACLDELNCMQPELVERVARSYVQAGSRVILTSKFRANPISLAQFGLDAQCEAINRVGAQISRKAAGTSALVFASMGPSGKMLLTKEVTPEQLTAAFSRQARALASESPDAIVIETMTDLTEARIAAAAALKTGLPVVVSFVFASGMNGDCTVSGATPEQAAAIIASDGVHAVGANCGLAIREYIPICSRLAAATSLPIWIKPNAGLLEMVDGRAEYKLAPAEFVAAASELIEAGATFIGGCCGTSPPFIQALAQNRAIAKLSPAPTRSK